MDFFKKNWKWLSVIALIVYTIIVVVITINVHSAYLSKKINNAFSDAFSNVFSTDDSITDTTSKNEVITKIDNNTENEITSTSSQNNIAKEPQKEITSVNFGESVTTDDWITSLINYRIAKKIEPAKKPSYYHYYEAKEEGHQYLAIDFDFKNLSAEEVNTYRMINMTLKYDNKYIYSSPLKVVEESDGDYTGYDWYFDIEPLKTQKLHYLFDLPDDVINSEGSIDVYITIGENEYKLNIR